MHIRRSLLLVVALAVGFHLSGLPALLSGGSGAALAGQKRGKGKRGGKKDKKKESADAPKAADKPKPADEQPATEYAITTGEPTHSPSNLPEHQDQGRILGSLKRCPGCTIEALCPEMGARESVAVPRGEPEYQLPWLKPGTYLLRITGGNRQLMAPNIPVEAGQYTRVDIEFTPQPPSEGSGENAASEGTDLERWPTWRPPAEPKIPVPNFKPKSVKELERVWDTDDGRNRHKKSGKGRRKKGKGKGNIKGKVNQQQTTTKRVLIES